MFDFSNFYQIIAKNQLQHWLRTLPAQLHLWQQEQQHGLFPRWVKALDKLPHITTNQIDLTDSVTIGNEGELSPSLTEKTLNLLQHLHPWRKGPYTLHGIHIDTEWRSDWKWERVLPHLSDLKYRYVLDVGCGNGYHMWRMLGAGAEFVVGIDPCDLFLAQFEAVRHFANNNQRVHLLPLGIEQLPELKAFDTVFSMGVLYHRRSPIDHILQLKNQLRPGGELVLETLIVDGDEHQVLVPEDRYAKMRNVWFLPSADALAQWVRKCGFTDVRVVDICNTTTNEQRQTQWMRNESLADFLDPDDSTKTIEGHPAPKRAVLIATNPV